MQRILLAFAFTAAICGSTTLFAQADAQTAYQAAKTAFDAGRFAEARDQARKATETDVKNPEAFLLLGKAHFQLGELDEAVEAWKKTLALAPQEPFATKMLEALRGQKANTDTRIKLVAAMIAERLCTEALDEIQKLLADKALTETQRVAVLLLKAEALIDVERDKAAGYGNIAAVQRVLQEVTVVYPGKADALQLALFEGRVKLRSAVSAGEGLAILKKVVADHPKTEAAATAQYELIGYQLKQVIAPEGVNALLAWVEANAKHPLARRAKQEVIGYLLVLPMAPPKPDGVLAATDAKALALAAAYLKEVDGGADSAKIIDVALNRLTQVYIPAKAYAAAVSGVETLLSAPLPRPAKRTVLLRLAEYKFLAAKQQLDEEAAVGKLPATAKDGELPKNLEDVRALYVQIAAEFPEQPAWDGLIQVATEVRGYSARVVTVEPLTTLKAPDAWAFELALSVIRADAGGEPVSKAVNFCVSMIDEQSTRNQPGSLELTVALSARLVRAVPPASLPLWSQTMWLHANRQGSLAVHRLHEDVKAGNVAAQAKLSPQLEAMLKTLEQLAARNAERVNEANVMVPTVANEWAVRGQWNVAEELYTRLIAMLKTPLARHQAEVGLVGNVWIAQVVQEHQRLSAAGMTVPQKLDPQLEKAMTRLYELQAGLDPKGTELAQIRTVIDSIVAHYKALEYYDTAAAALKVKPEKAVPAADEYAAFQLLVLDEEAARRAFARDLNRYGAAEKIALSESLRKALDGWTQFVTERPTSSLASQAVDRVFGIARLFENHQAYSVAADVYRQFAAVAAKVKPLATALPATASVAQRATFAAAMALDSQARKALAKSQENRRSDTPPPAKLSDEFATALTAYLGVIEGAADNPLASDAVNRIMAIALEYARIDAWDVADTVFADLLKSKLKIRRPERLEFARAMCQLGRVMPEHAREVLTALSATGLRAPTESSTPVALAMAEGAGYGGGRPAAGPQPPTPPTSVPAGATAPSTPVPQPVIVQGSGTLTLSGATTSAGDASVQVDISGAKRDADLLAMIHRQESQRASQVAQLRENAPPQYNMPQKGQAQGQQAKFAPPAPLLSEAELARVEKALAAAYDIFQAIRKAHAESPTAEQARGEILVMVAHWRSLSQWQRAAALAERFLADNPRDRQLPQLRLEIARDRLAWAAKPLEKTMTRSAMLAEVAKRFTAARDELTKVISDFPQERNFQQEAQWDLANNYLTEARAIAAISPTLAQGQYVRAARELRAVAGKYPTHPRLGTIPDLLWGIAQELSGRGFDDEAIFVYSDLITYDPLHGLAQQALAQIAEIYRHKLKRPLKAAEAYLELNFARGGNDAASQSALFEIGTQLKNDKRWVEALHVLETFVDSFPRHPQAGQALTMAGQIHQTNQAWEDAILAYNRVIAEYKDGQWVLDAKWSIAECRINLSKWNEAQAAYRDFVAAFPQDSKVAEANRRIEILKDLARYQGLVDEKGQRKSFDAQYQIAQIVRSQLANPIKAIIEYRKVVANWPESHLADDALYDVGATYLTLGETEKARAALLQVAAKYPSSPLADDALFMVGRSYEDEADKLGTVTREKQIAQAKETAQRSAYELVQGARRSQVAQQQERVSSLKKAGKSLGAEAEEARNAFNVGQFNDANVVLFAQKAEQDVEALTATQLADRQDKINAALRKAVDSYTSASKVAGGDKAGDALLQMATIYDQRLKDSKAAMDTWLEIVRQFSGTAVAEDASWKIAQYYEREKKYAEAIDAYNAFLRNYRRSPNAGAAQFAIAEGYEHLGQWVQAMDSYSKYITNFAEGPLVNKAKEQINWIKTYRL